jgi:hypothetical protein
MSSPMASPMASLMDSLMASLMLSSVLIRGPRLSHLAVRQERERESSADRHKSTRDKTRFGGTHLDRFTAPRVGQPYPASDCCGTNFPVQRVTPEPGSTRS